MKEVKKCPFCGEEILAAANKCKHCGEWLDNEAASKTSQSQPEQVRRRGKQWLLTSSIAAILTVAIAFFVKTTKEPTTNVWKTMSNNLITSTSIGGVEVIGKTQKELKSKFDEGFRWDFSDYGYDFTGWGVKKGETSVFAFNIDPEEFDVVPENRKIFIARIIDPSYFTADGLRVGSTSGDVMKKYPEAKIDEWAYSDHGIQYTTINDINFYFDYECKVADQTGLIVNKTCKIISIEISGIRKQ